MPRVWFQDREDRVTPMCITVMAVTKHLDLDPIVQEPNLAHREEESGDVWLTNYLAVQSV